MNEPDFETVPSWGSVIVTGFIAVVAGRVAILTTWAAIDSVSVVIRWLATTATIGLGLATVVAAGYAIGAGLSILTHFDTHRQVRTAEAQKRIEEAKQTKYRTWEIEDELGIDLDGDGIIGDPGNRGLIAGLVHGLFSRRGEPGPRRPRTNRYLGKQEPAGHDEETPVNTMAKNRALDQVQQFVIKTWNNSDDPNVEAKGAARSQWCGPNDGLSTLRRQRYEAIMTILRNRPIAIIAGRGDGKVGYFTTDTVDEALGLVRRWWDYVSETTEIVKILTASQPSPGAQATSET